MGNSLPIFNVSGTNTLIRPKYVRVSEDESGEYRSVYCNSDPKCFFQPDVKRCYDLEFVLKTLLVYRLDWIDVVFIEDTQDDRYYKNEIDSFKYTSNNPRTITIKCHLQFCTFRSHFGLISKSFKRHMLIVVENVQFTDTRITLYNMNVHFKIVKFVNTTLTDKPVFKTRAQLFDLIVTFTNIIFLNPSSNGQGHIKF